MYVRIPVNLVEYFVRNRKYTKVMWKELITFCYLYYSKPEMRAIGAGWIHKRLFGKWAETTPLYKAIRDTGLMDWKVVHRLPYGDDEHEPCPWRDIRFTLTEELKDIMENGEYVQYSISLQQAYNLPCDAVFMLGFLRSLYKVVGNTEITGKYADMLDTFHMNRDRFIDVCKLLSSLGLVETERVRKGGLYRLALVEGEKGIALEELLTDDLDELDDKLWKKGNKRVYAKLIARIKGVINDVSKHTRNFLLSWWRKAEKASTLVASTIKSMDEYDFDKVLENTLNGIMSYWDFTSEDEEAIVYVT